MDSMGGDAGPAATAPPDVETPICDGAVTVGLMGVWSCVLGPPILALADESGLEPFSWPPPSMALGYVLVAMMMAAYMFLLLGALAYSSPTFVSVCSLFVTPVTLVWDVAAGRTAGVSPVSFLAMALLLASLLLVIFHAEGDAWLRRRARAAVVAMGCSLATPLLGSLSAEVAESAPHGEDVVPSGTSQQPSAL